MNIVPIYNQAAYGEPDRENNPPVGIAIAMEIIQGNANMQRQAPIIHRAAASAMEDEEGPVQVAAPAPVANPVVQQGRPVVERVMIAAAAGEQEQAVQQQPAAQIQLPPAVQNVAPAQQQEQAVQQPQQNIEPNLAQQVGQIQNQEIMGALISAIQAQLGYIDTDFNENDRIWLAESFSAINDNLSILYQWKNSANLLPANFNQINVCLRLIDRLLSRFQDVPGLGGWQ